MIARRWFVLVALLPALACASPSGVPSSPPRMLEYRVGPPDQLLISVSPDPVLVRTVTVRPDGRISFDLVGDVNLLILIKRFDDLISIQSSVKHH